MRFQEEKQIGITSLYIYIYYSNLRNHWESPHELTRPEVLDSRRVQIPSQHFISRLQSTKHIQRN